MIIQIRGTSGSGKSTVMQTVMRAFPVGCTRWEPKMVEGRKRPLYYRRGNVIVLGHYEIACGGCDTIGSVPQVFAELAKLPPDKTVLCEGLLLSEDVIWSVKANADNVVKCLFLTTPVAECLRRVDARQKEAGRTPTDPARVVRKLSKRVETIERARKRLVQAGVECRRCTSEQAPGIVLGWLQNG